MRNLLEAQKRIEKVANRRGEYLSLAQLDLTTDELEQLIPFMLKKLPYLMVLSLAHNRLKTIPKTIFLFKSLEELDVSFNPSLQNITKLLTKLPGFSNLIISTGQLTTLAPGIDAFHDFLAFRSSS